MSNVEFSLVQTGIKGEKGFNFISTSHNSCMEKSFYYLYRTQLAYFYNFRTYLHSHPNTPKASDADVKQKNHINSLQSQIGLTIPKYYIYHVPTKTTIAY